MQTYDYVHGVRTQSRNRHAITFTACVCRVCLCSRHAMTVRMHALTVPRHAMTVQKERYTGHKTLRSTADCLIRLAVQHNKERRVVNRRRFLFVLLHFSYESRCMDLKKMHLKLINAISYNALASLSGSFHNHTTKRRPIN